MGYVPPDPEPVGLHPDKWTEDVDWDELFREADERKLPPPIPSGPLPRKQRHPFQ